MEWNNSINSANVVAGKPKIHIGSIVKIKNASWEEVVWQIWFDESIGQLEINEIFNGSNFIGKTIIINMVDKNNACSLINYTFKKGDEIEVIEDGQHMLNDLRDNSDKSSISAKFEELGKTQEWIEQIKRLKIFGKYAIESLALQYDWLFPLWVRNTFDMSGYERGADILLKLGILKFIIDYPIAEKERILELEKQIKSWE